MTEMGKDLTSPTDVFTLEQIAMTKLNTFNQAYANYLRCGDTNNQNQNYIDKSACKETDKSVYKTTVDSAYEDLSGALISLDDALNKMGKREGKTPEQYDASYNSMLSTYNDLVKTRQEIDEELAELYNTTDGVNSFYNKMYMSTMYSKILLTILATSLLYYVIMKLRKK